MTALTGSGPGAAEVVDAFLPRPFVVRRGRQDTRDTYTLVLEPTDGQAMEFVPGQFTMMQAFGTGEAPISISGDPAHPEVLEHTIRSVGNVTRFLVHARPGTELGIRGPFGTGWEASSGKGGDVVFVAGGIGLAPLRPAILEVCAARGDYGRVLVLYGARTPEDILFGDDLRRWGTEHDLDVQVTVDNGQHAWQGRVGLVTQLITRGGFDAPNALALVCGPEVMMRYAAAALVERGVARDRLRLSMERAMKCGIGLCGHCQLREFFLCVDGPVLTYDQLEPLMSRAEL
jgi:NAD(P)H-flavin reductase